LRTRTTVVSRSCCDSEDGEGSVWYRTAEQEGLRDLVVVTEFALHQGLLAPSQTNKPGEIAPSAYKLASFLHISKTDAAKVRDAVNAKAGATA
jgi:hypothetical protein